MHAQGREFIVIIGCIDAIEPHLPTLMPYLINTLNDPKVRAHGLLPRVWLLIAVFP